MRIQLIGLDMSLTSTGVCNCFIEHGDILSAPTHTIITTPKGFNTRRERVVHIIKRIRDIISSSCTQIFLIEMYAFAHKSTNVVQLGELGGMVRQYAYKESGIEPIEIPIGSLKKYMTGKGTGKKEDMKLAVYKKFKKDFQNRSNDECDAYCLCRLGADLLGLVERKLNKKENEALDAVVKHSRFQYLQTMELIGNG